MLFVLSEGVCDFCVLPGLIICPTLMDVQPLPASPRDHLLPRSTMPLWCVLLPLWSSSPPIFAHTPSSFKASTHYSPILHTPFCQHFSMNIFKYRKNWKKLHSEDPYTQHLDFTISILQHLVCLSFLNTSVWASLQSTLFLMHFLSNYRHECTSSLTL